MQKQKHVLKEVIQKMIKGLESYVLRPDASPKFVDSQNELIKILVAIYNSLPDFTEGGKFSWLEKEISRLESCDPTISGHNIIIRTKPLGDNFSLISKSFYDRI